MSGRLKRSVTILITFSATCYALAFWWTSLFCWLIFVFLIPLFYVGLKYPEQVTAALGLWWGVLFYALHGYSIVQLFYEKASGNLRVIVAVVILAYCAIYAGIWFFIARHYAQLCKAPWWRAAAWISATVVYFIWMEQYAWFPLGTCMGYCFASPLLPLAEYKEFLALLPYMMPVGLLTCLVGGSMAVAYVLACVRMRYLVVAGICWLPFMCGWFKNYEISIPAYVQQMHYVAPPSKDKHPLDCAEHITYALLKCRQDHPQVAAIVMPESSFPFAINEYPEALHMWSENALFDDVVLLIGTHRKEGETCFNSLCCIQRSRVSVDYDKNLLMPLTEFLPPFYKECAVLKELFLNGNKEFTTNNSSDCCSLCINADFHCIPRICAELYFDTDFSPPENVPVLCLVNDSWFSASYMRHLMYLFARYKALAWNHEVIYASHYQGVWIAPNGITLDLA